MILYYKNSLLASVVSILGCVLLMVVIFTWGEYSVEEMILPAILGVAMLIWGKVISNNKAFKTWWKGLEEAGIPERIKTDDAMAELIYQKHPKKATLNKIRQLNPGAAAAIEAALVKK